jgi:hypothetical protein
LQVLNSADEEELNYVLCTVNCAMLVEVAKVETMDMLTAPEHRLHELTLMTRRAAARISSNRRAQLAQPGLFCQKRTKCLSSCLCKHVWAAPTEQVSSCRACIRTPPL